MIKSNRAKANLQIECSAEIEKVIFVSTRIRSTFMMRLFNLLALLCIPFFLMGKDYNILSYGAIADGRTLNTRMIQNAIDEAHTDGGGRVVIPVGSFLSGSLVLKSGVEIHLLENAILLGSTRPDDYLKLKRWKALILADGQEGLAITGKGTIDGQGRALALHIDSLFYAGQIDSAQYNFNEMRPKYYLRPQLIEFVRCKNIRVEEVVLKNAACWVQTYDVCENILIDKITVDSDAYWNNDGIDIQDCINVRVTNCFVNAADDGICIKSQSKKHYCDSIYIGNCTVRSSASAVKFGTVSHGGFSNVVIENIKVYDTFRSAIAIEAVDGGVLENVLVQNVEATNTGNAIFIRLGKRNKKGAASTLRKVVLKNIKVEVPLERPDYKYAIRGPALPFFHNTFPVSIVGLPTAKIEDLVLDNISIQYPGRGNKGLAYAPLSRLDAVPELASEYPEFSMFKELPAWGFYVRHVNGLTMRNVFLQIAEADYRPAMVFDDVQHLSLDNILISGDVKKEKIIFHRVQESKLAPALSPHLGHY